MGLAAIVEERDLVDHFGPEYEDYQRRVPRFVPRLTTVPAGAAAVPELSTSSDGVRSVSA
jgi:hypothetical protein